MPSKKMIHITHIKACSFKGAEHPLFVVTSMYAYQLSAGVQGIRISLAKSRSIKLFQRRNVTEVLCCFRKELMHHRKEGENTKKGIVASEKRGEKKTTKQGIDVSEKEEGGDHNKPNPKHHNW